MSRRPISRSDDLRRLQSEGYTVQILGGKLVVRDVPFVDREGAVHHDGVLVTTLTLAGDTARPPDDHTASFAGGIPCDRHGNELTKIINGRGQNNIGNGIVIDCTFSMKPLENNGRYADFYEKVTKYIAAISGHASDVDASARAAVFKPVIPDDDDDTPFNYIDTASSRAGIDAITEKLKNERVGIIGLGGTGEYILDFVAKTPVAEIRLFDGDEFLTHNAFRGPGAPSLAELTEAPLKVEHFARLYSNMRKGIVARPYPITAENVAELPEMTFVFISIDSAPAKAPIIAALLDFGIPFIDVGMGVEMVEDHLTGIVRTTTVTPEKNDHVTTRISTVEAVQQGDYRSNIQIAELNARNASDAVIRWKKYRGIYADLGTEHFSALSITTNHVFNSDRTDESDGQADACA